MDLTNNKGNPMGLYQDIQNSRLAVEAAKNDPKMKFKNGNYMLSYAFLDTAVDMIANMNKANNRVNDIQSSRDQKLDNIRKYYVNPVVYMPAPGVKYLT